MGETLQRAERLLTDTDAVVRRRQEDARRTAEATIAAAEVEAQQLRESARAEAQAERAAAQRTVEKLERQRESVAAYLDEMRGLLGSKAAAAIAGLSPLGGEEKETRVPVEIPTDSDVDAYALPEEESDK
nr:hypothetical protein [Mobiluncus mulieris]